MVGTTAADDVACGDGNETRTCVVLGGRGFLGRSLVTRLLRLGGWFVRIADSSSHLLQLDRSAASDSILSSALSSGRASFCHVDVRDTSQIIKVTEGAGVVFYMERTDLDTHDIYSCYKIIVQGVKNVINACQECKVRRLIYNSSADVVFDGSKDILVGDESFSCPGNFPDVLIDFNLQAEELIRLANNIDGLATCVLRPSNAFGPGDTWFVPLLVNLAKSGLAKFITGRGENMCDFTYAENVAHAHICAAETLDSRSVSVAGKAFFITNLEPMMFWEFASHILEGLGPFIKVPSWMFAYTLSLLQHTHEESHFRIDKYSPHYIVQLASRTRTFDCSAAQKHLGYSPVIYLEIGNKYNVSLLKFLLISIVRTVGHLLREVKYSEDGVRSTIASFSHLAKDSSFMRDNCLNTIKAVKLLGSGIVKENYSDLGNASQVFEIKLKLKDIRQGMLENNYDFLAWMNRELDEVRGHILGKTPLPAISEAFAEVWREERGRRVVMGDMNEPKLVTNIGHHSVETSALISRGEVLQTSHLSWDNKNQKDNKALLSSSTSSIPIEEVLDVCLTRSQLEILHKMLGTSTSHGSLVVQGTALNTTSDSSNQSAWILDSGAFDHMTVSISSKPRDCSVSEVSPLSSSIDLPIVVSKGTRTCTQHPISRFVSYGNLSKTYKTFVSNVDHVKTPRSVEESLESTEWKRAVMEEMNALKNNGTWEVLNLPEGKKTLSCKWIFTKKFKPDGSIDWHKALLVAKGFTLTYGLDYDETFAPIAKFNTVRVLFSLAINLDWPLTQLDVKNDFLNGELNNEAMTSSEYTQGQTDHTLFYNLDWPSTQLDVKNDFLNGHDQQGVYSGAGKCFDSLTETGMLGSVNDRRFTSGCCSYVWGNLVTWRSKKQSVITRSSAEAEYRALSHGICEGIWIQRLMGELKIPHVRPMKICLAVEKCKENTFMLPCSGFFILLVLSLRKNFYLICSQASAASYCRSLWIWKFISEYLFFAFAPFQAGMKMVRVAIFLYIAKWMLEYYPLDVFVRIALVVAFTAFIVYEQHEPVIDGLGWVLYYGITALEELVRRSLPSFPRSTGHLRPPPRIVVEERRLGISAFRVKLGVPSLALCVTRIMVARIKPFLSEVISKSQTAFIPGRCIRDSTLVAQELVKALGMPVVMVGWIKACVTNPYFSLSSNVRLMGYFKGYKGLR
ncbi:3beta-hydroxysteroid-dehydrogenase/decarboxylase isoform 3 [Hibiscus syriacus]|uniref:3beta-hydroxysteroid-dehydrogenase/decarboxylase isoform 3 n=1 Tax=Hibiscus syriacus TaxID=106335 RepID=A0A6A3AAN5_HIBSY|nr:3beta-hydroxysteroid-dehydrogenase/decarboxylase isoform 3 [Hibiscus syriacus]